MLKIFDSTLRDGSHAIKQQLSLQNIADYCLEIDDVGVYTVIVGHGNGLGASTLNVGLSKESDCIMLGEAKKHLNKTKLGAFLIPGFGTIQDNLIPAFIQGVDLVCVASHCTEANITRQHIEYILKEDKEVYGVLMLQHTINDEMILEQAKMIEGYGGMGVILMDSAGASLPNAVRHRIAFLKEHLNIPVGFHSHNNLGMAIINSVVAAEAGADIIDGTVRGFGAGAGNCQLEVFVAVMEKMGYPTGVDLYKMMEISDYVVNKFSSKEYGISPLNLISGIAGVFSSYSTQVEEAAAHYGVDPRDIFIEMGKRKTVGGQEDIVVEVAAYLSAGRTNIKKEE